ncbi:MAG: aspartate-semialdehyde dehydrogenase [Deltaproteobacteria bacterium RIFCSPLOWO2_02_FULL_53_8]|nr:MAG: aspartate-semialdehyde dehydrogenase [Deltaproteobacteria bacterium RIFCSPLOWO2_02_FULL_53_8]
MKKKSYCVAIAGATGVVGKELLKTLEERNFPVGELRLLASERSAGQKLEFKGVDVLVRRLEDETFEGVDIGLFSPGASVSAIYAPKAAKAGCIVVDNTSEFRMDPLVPLVVPEVNPAAIAGYTKKNIIANPNCSTIQMVVALKPIHDKFKIKRIVVSTYQSVSGAGKEAMEELSEQIKALFNMREPEVKVLPQRIAFNCIPQIDSFLDNGYTKEEMKMVNETQKIFGDPSVKVTATTVRVPVFVGHSESVNIETELPITPEEVRRILKKAPGVTVADDPKKGVYATPADVATLDDTFVSRIRKDDTVPNGINMWIVADNLRKGAALNAVQIAEILIRDYI